MRLLGGMSGMLFSGLEDRIDLPSACVTVADAEVAAAFGVLERLHVEDAIRHPVYRALSLHGRLQALDRLRRARGRLVRRERRLGRMAAKEAHATTTIARLRVGGCFNKRADEYLRGGRPK